MLNASKQIGFKFMKREYDILTLKVFNVEMCFKQIAMLPFDPIRKMMSIVVKTPDNDVIMFSKGADTTMIKAIRGTPARKRKMQEKTDKFGNLGYRTMVMAMRKFDH